MSSKKFDKLLKDEILVIKKQTRDEDLEKLKELKFEVTIEVIGSYKHSSNLSRQEAREEMEHQSEQFQAGIVESLNLMGITEYDRLVLSNSIAAALTMSQIQEIAMRDEVKMIRLVKIQKVTTD
jgi:hypothetical protein